MSRPREWDWKESVTVYLTALLLALGMSLLFYKALFPQQAVWPSVAWCALFCLILHVFFSLRFRFKWLIGVAAFAAPLVWLALDGGPLYPVIQGVKAASLSFSTVPEAAAPYASQLRWAMCLLFSLLASSLAWDRTLPLALFSVVAVTVLSFVLGARAQLLLYVLPAAAGLLLLLAGNEGKRPVVVIAACALAGGAFLLLPPAPRTVQPLEKAATDLRQFVEDYLLFNEFRSTFSLTTEGYQPLDNRLGGKAQPSHREVMEVTGDRTVLLRGRAYDDYSGLNWYDTLASRRFLYASPRFTAQRDELFDLVRPLAGDLPQAATLSVRMLGDATTTLFTPCRTLSMQMESDRMVLYYNLASERFITRNLALEDRYSLTYLPFAPGQPETSAAIAACADRNDPHYDQIAGQYLEIPRHIQQEIYDIAAKATENAQTPYEKALAIQRYLQTNYRYNLNVATPPEGVDFAAWFLIGEKEGYCTYFATAMTLLCRISGIPARYVTGYLAVPDESGKAVVTGENAHAWTEIYLNGFGWLDIDATPRGDNRPGSDSGEDAPDHQPSPPPSPSPSPAPSPTPPPSAPQETPTPEPPPSAPPDSDSPDAPTPTPEPPAPGETPAPEPDRKDPDTPGKQPPFPWWILLILLFAALLALRLYFTEPLRRAGKHPEKAAAILFGAIGALLAARRLRHGPAETLHAFAARADIPLRAKSLPEITPLADSYAAQLYGRHPADPAPFADAYRALRSRASRWTRFRLAVKRIFGR